MKLDICMPTYGGATTIERSLEFVRESLATAEGVTAEKFRFDIRPAGAGTETIVRSFCDRHGFDYDVHVTEHNLPEAREHLIHETEAPWLLFLDDDVYLEEPALLRLRESIAQNVGALQPRRATDTHEPYEWSRWRPIRGTCFATLIRTEAVAGISIPSDCTVLEDEFIRRYVESSGYVWVFDHAARFTHDTQDRHQIDFNEGRIAGRYGLLPAWYIFGNVGMNLRRPSELPKHVSRAAGYTYGRATA